MATQLGTTLIIGGQRTLTNYIVETDEVGGNDIDMEDVLAADGTRATRIIFKIDEKAKLSLICKTGATPASDFPEGAMCTLTGLTGWYVDSAPITKSKSAQKVSVTLTNIHI